MTTYCFTGALCLSFLLRPLFAFPASDPKIRVGIMPTYAQGVFPTYRQRDLHANELEGLNFTQSFNRHLTVLIYQSLDKSSVEPMLLNPGGLYLGMQDNWTLDVGQQNHTDVLLITVLEKVEAPKSGDLTLRIKSDLWDLKRGNAISSWESSARVNTRDLAYEDFRIQLGEGSRRFDKQPLGAAARKIAEDIRNQVTQATASLTPTSKASDDPTQSGTCHVDFRIVYVAKHSSSKSYDIVVNGKDETLSIADGVLSFTAQSGPLLIQLAVHDPPYKMPKQDFYQANTRLDCSQATNDLRLEIGPAGEGSLKWQ